MPFAGGLFGVLIMLFISDNYGRRLAYGVSWLIASLGTLLMVIFH